MSDKIIEMTKKEWEAKGERLYGKDRWNWKFRCPACGHVQCIGDFQKFKCQGATPDDAYFNCIGRFDGHIKTNMGTKPGPCNYTTGGLFNISPIKVHDGEREHSCFDFADEEKNGKD